MVHVIEYFAKLLKVTQNGTIEYDVRISILLYNTMYICISYRL